MSERIGNTDCTLLDEINPLLYLCSKRGSIMQTGDDTANITIASEAAVQFLINHESHYRAFVTCNDSLNMTYVDFKNIFGKACQLLYHLLNQYLQQNLKTKRLLELKMLRVLQMPRENLTEVVKVLTENKQV